MVQSLALVGSHGWLGIVHSVEKGNLNLVYLCLFNFTSHTIVWCLEGFGILLFENESHSHSVQTVFIKTLTVLCTGGRGGAWDLQRGVGGACTDRGGVRILSRPV